MITDTIICKAGIVNKAATSFIILLFLFPALIFPDKASSQVLPYTNPIFQIRKDSAVFVDSAINFCNRNTALKINVYKPVADGNLQRPIIIFVHGGGNVSTTNFNDAEMNVFAQEFAKRGYVGVSMEYREGGHLRQYGQGSPSLTAEGILTMYDDGSTNNFQGKAHCFLSDSAEAIRAGYRAQQDVKAVIRMMKENHLADSTSTCKVFLGGHSAGAIDIFSTIFLDQESEKPTLASALASVPNPSWLGWGFWFFGTWVNTQIGGPYQKDDAVYRFYNPAPFNFNASACYTRPDLGPINGVSHISGGYDTKVMGAAVLAGAVVDTTLFTSQSSQPALFLYHIPGDIVVPYNSGKPFNYFNANPLTGSPLFDVSINENWPVMYGSNWINNKFNSIGYPGAKTFWSYTGGDVNFATSHSILPGVPFVADSIAKFFARVMDTSTICNLVVLPIKLENFICIKQECNKVKLEWKVAEADNFSHFEAERSSNGNDWQTIALVLPENGIRQYTYYDNNLANDNYQYRLKLVDKDGQYSYSKIISTKISCNNGNQILVYPNPAKGLIYIEGLKGGETIKLFNSAGQLVSNTQSTGYISALRLNGFVPGMYILLVKKDKTVLLHSKVMKLAD